MSKRLPVKVLEEAAEWIDIQLELSVEQKRTLQQWLDADPQHALAFAYLQSIMLDPALLDAATEARNVIPIERGKGNTGVRIPARSWVIAGGLAAVASVVISAVVLFNISPVELRKAPDLVAAEYVAPAFEVREFTLSDGSSAKLNASTRLTTEFSDKERLLTLDFGNALFAVAKDPGVPFIVRAGDAEVTATGTVFEIDRLSNLVEVRLYEGSVRLVSASGLEGELRGRQAAKLFENGTISVEALPASAKSDWAEGWLVADNMALQHVLERMNRYRETPVRLGSKELGGELVSGRFRLDRSDASLKLLSTLLPLQLEERDGQVYLMPDTSRAGQ